MITREELEYQYNVLNKNKDDIRREFKITKRRLPELFKEYGITKTNKKDLIIKNPKIDKPEFKIPKDELIDLYVNHGLTKREILRHYKLPYSVLIDKLLIEYDIEPIIEKESEVAKNRRESNELKLILPKEKFIEEMQISTMQSISTRYDISLNVIKRWIKEYDIKTSNTKNLGVHELLRADLDADKFMSPKELSIKYGISTKDLKYIRKEFIEKSYSIDEIKTKLIEYEYDLNNQGLVKQIYYDDIGLYNSIIKHTDSHILQGSKFTERLYRLLNEYKPDKICMCNNCKVNTLKFYTMALGYGNSDYNICIECNTVLNGISKMSQDFFDIIYKQLKSPDNCFYSNMIGEQVIYIPKEYAVDNIHCNRNYYRIDFLLKNKIVEFDGHYFHTDVNKEDAKDNFLKSKGYEVLHITDIEYRKFKNETIQKCLDFLEPNQH